MSGSEDCKVYLRTLLEEDNDQTRQRMEAHLNRFDDGEVIDALMEIDEAVKDEPTLLLRLLQLSRKIMSNHKRVSTEAAMPESAASLDEVRSEMARTLRDLDEDEDEEAQEINSVANTADDAEGNAWSLWEGPWIPKPIGSIQ